MKKVVSILISILFLFSFAYAKSEITFQNVTWLSDDALTFKVLSDAGLIRNGSNGLEFTDEDPLYIIEDDTGFISPDRMTGTEDVTFVANLGNSVKGKIAGYPVKDLTFVFAYDGEYKLISVKVDLIKAKYEDLKSKLIKVFGEGDHKTSEEGIDSIIWKGENNSAVVLYTQSEGLDYTLMYGRLDANEILSQCLEANPEDVSGL